MLQISNLKLKLIDFEKIHIIAIPKHTNYQNLGLEIKFVQYLGSVLPLSRKYAQSSAETVLTAHSSAMLP